MKQMFVWYNTGRKPEAEEKEMNIHQGHRQRKRRQFLDSGEEHLADHELLELLLFYAIPQRDTNPIAHALMERFGSLQSVFSATEEELMEIPYIGESAVALLQLVPALHRRMMISGEGQETVLNTTARLGEFFQKLMAGRRGERVYQLCLDKKGRKLALFEVGRGSASMAAFNVRPVMQNALRTQAEIVVLAHNHPSGVALPSYEDQTATRMVAEALGTVGIRLADHIIVADGDYVSLADSGYLGGY